MRTATLVSISAAFGAAGANILSGPFDIVAKTLEGDLWNTSITTVSHGYTIISLVIGERKAFSWNNATSRLVPTSAPSMYSAIGGPGTVIVLWGPDGPWAPDLQDGPVKQVQIGDEVYLVAPNNNNDTEPYQWSSRFEAEHLPSGLQVEVPGSESVNAALLLVPRTA